MNNTIKKCGAKSAASQSSADQRTMHKSNLAAIECRDVQHPEIGMREAVEYEATSVRAGLEPATGPSRRPEQSLPTIGVEQGGEMPASRTEVPAASPDVRCMEIVTYMRSNSAAGSFAIIADRAGKVFEASAYFPSTTGPELDRAAFMAAYELVAQGRRSIGFNQPEAELLAARLSSSRPQWGAGDSCGSALRERFRSGWLIPCAITGYPLGCALKIGALSHLDEVRELAIRTYWTRNSMGES